MTTQKKKSTPKKKATPKAAKTPVAQEPKESAPIAPGVKLPAPAQAPVNVAPSAKKKSFLRRFFGF